MVFELCKDTVTWFAQFFIWMGAVLEIGDYGLDIVSVFQFWFSRAHVNARKRAKRACRNEIWMNGNVVVKVGLFSLEIMVFDLVWW